MKQGHCLLSTVCGDLLASKTENTFQKMLEYLLVVTVSSLFRFSTVRPGVIYLSLSPFLTVELPLCPICSCRPSGWSNRPFVSCRHFGRSNRPCVSFVLVALLDGRIIPLSLVALLDGRIVPLSRIAILLSWLKARMQ